MKLNVNEFVLTKLDPECGLAQPQLVSLTFWNMKEQYLKVKQSQHQNYKEINKLGLSYATLRV